ncbi:MAG: glutamate synthase subunit beta [Clostridia bacterium]|nr:glutamate synthase subunit beta [Clostridia bacterium]
MGNTKGFLEYARQENPYREPCGRLRDYDGLHVPQPDEVRLCQAARCMDCGVPFCQSGFGCPLHNLIPEWNGLLSRGQEKEALMRLLMTAPFPEFTGRVCPALCEKACNLADEGVTNRDNELYLIETAFRKGWIRPRIPAVRTGKRIAVVGSGPAGLAAADLLNRMGHSVVVIERADRPGGLLTYGIPNMKLPKTVVERRIRLMEAEGIVFLPNTGAAPDLTDAYDAVLLCCGSRKPRSLDVEGCGAQGVYYAVDYLTSVTKVLLDGTVPAADAAGKDVVVVGGGDTGCDCVGTALRQGCRSVVQLEILPAAPEKRMPDNPWPQQPRVLRTDYGQQEAVYVQGGDPRLYETTVKGIRVNGENRITALETVRVKKELDGRFRPVGGTERTLPCGLLLIAAGFEGCETAGLEGFYLPVDPRGNIRTPEGSHHVAGSLFAAGDMRTGQSLVVRAMADGRSAAREVDDWLKG